MLNEPPFHRFCEFERFLVKDWSILMMGYAVIHHSMFF